MVSNLVPLLICVDDGDTIGALTDRVAKALVGALRHQQFRRWPDLVADATRLDTGVEFGPVINVLSFAAPFRFGSSETTYNVLKISPYKTLRSTSIRGWVTARPEFSSRGIRTGTPPTTSPGT